MADIGAKIAIDGEKQFKQELQNITQAGKTLSAQMNALTSSFDQADASEEDMAKVSKKLNEQIQNQQKLVDKLREAVANSAQKTGENSTETLKWKEKLAKAEGELSKLEKSADGAGKEVGELAGEEKNATEKTSLFGDMLRANLASEAIKKGVSMLADAVKDVAKFFVDAVKGAAEYADSINTLAKTTGMSTDSIQEYKYAADLLDVSFETISGSMTKLTKSMDSARDGGKTAIEAFAKLGVEVTDANGNLRDSNEVFDDVIVALGKIDNETERDAVAMEVFGKSAKELNPLIEAGAENLSDLRDEAHKVGAVLDNDTLDTLNDVQDGFDRLGQTWDALKRTLGAKLGAKILPDLQKIVGLFQDLASTGDFGKFVDGVSDMVDGIIKKLPQYSKKIIKAIPKILIKITNAIEKLLPDLVVTIGEVLGQLFAKLPAILHAGLELAGALIRGVLMAIPNLIIGIVNGFDDALDESEEVVNEHVEEIRGKLSEIPDALSRIESSMVDIDARQREAEHWIEIFDELSKLTDPTAEDTERLQQAVDRLNELFPDLGIQLDEETGKWSLNTQEIRDNIAALQDRARAEAYQEAAAETLKQIVELEKDRKALEDELEAKGANKKAIDDRIKLLEAQATAIEELNQQYRDGKITQEEYVRAFDALGTGMAANFEEYDVYGNKVDGLEGSVLSLRTQIQGLQNDSDRIERDMKPIRDGINDVDTALDGLNNDVEWYFKKAANLSDEAEEIGGQTAKGYARGLIKYSDEVKQASRTLALASLREMKDALMIRSPSRVMEDEIGKNMALGVVKGWEDVFSKRNALSMQGVVGAMGATTNTMNLGGVSVNVYAQEGQDANAIANMVMRKMQGAVDARKAVFA